MTRRFLMLVAIGSSVGVFTPRAFARQASDDQNNPHSSKPAKKSQPKSKSKKDDVGNGLNFYSLEREMWDGNWPTPWNAMARWWTTPSCPSLSIGWLKTWCGIRMP